MAPQNEKKGLKNDAGKTGWFAMPLVVMKPLVDVFNAGVGHYGLHNCLNPFDNPSERFYDAQMRHVEDCQLDPLATDPQDGCYHEAKVAFNALMRLYHCRKLNDGNKEEQLLSAALGQPHISFDDDHLEPAPCLGNLCQSRKI